MLHSFAVGHEPRNRRVKLKEKKGENKSVKAKRGKGRVFRKNDQNGTQEKKEKGTNISLLTEISQTRNCHQRGQRLPTVKTRER